MSTPTVNANNPWPWLDPYTEGAAADFFNGREEDTAHLERLVRGNPATVLFGKSGLGKTSLLLAGLFPRLRAAGLLPVLVRLQHDDSAQPIAAQVYQRLLEACALHGLTPPGQPSASGDSLPEADRLWFDLHTQPGGACATDGSVLQLVLVLDQFEEVFTLGSRDANRLHQTLGSLGDLIENRIPAAVESAIAADEDLLDLLQLDAQPYRVVLMSTAIEY